MGRGDETRVVTRRRVATVAVLLLAVPAVTATGAVDLGDELLTPADQIHLQPAAGPNGDYATVDAEGALRVDVDGAVADGRTVLRRVFVVANTGSEPAAVWLTDDTPRVDYVAAGCGLDPTNRCRVPAGGTVAVGVVVDTETAVSASLVTIHARVPGANDSDPDATVTDGDGVRVEAEGVDPTENVTVDVSVGDGNVTVDSVTAATADRTNLSLAVDAGSNQTAAGTDVPEPTDGTAVGYVRVDHASPDETFAEVAFRVRVARDRLAAFGGTAESVQLLRYHEGSWERVETTPVDTTGETLVFRGVTPGLSAFAVTTVDDADAAGSGGGRAGGSAVPPTAAVTAPETAAVGESVTLDASATTDNAGVVRYRWDTDGDGTVETVSSTATVEWTFDTPGRSRVRVTAVDRAGLTDDATTLVRVEEDGTGNTTVAPNTTVTPNATGTPDETITPNATVTPNATATPDATAAPNATGTPTTTETPGSETATAATPVETASTATPTTTATAGSSTSETETATPTATETPITEAFGFPAREFGLLVLAVLVVVVVGWYRSRL
jgi:PGF-pre-PGF domain-containing protein